MKEKDHLDRDFKERASRSPINRRDFIKLTGSTGIIVFFSIGEVWPLQAEGQQERRPGLNYPEDFNAYLRIGDDGRVSCFTGKIEMGQGVITSLAQELAEELEVSIDMVDMVMGDTDLCPWDMGTFGSMTTRYFGPALRAARAEAKAVLMELASDHLKIPLSRLKAAEGVIFDKTQKEKKVAYATLTQGKRIERYLKEKPPVKNQSQFTVIGKPTSRTDSHEKVTGKAKFAGDFCLPGMLYARILRPPAHNAKLKSIDLSAAKKIKGIQIVQDGDLTAVLHENPDEAGKALKKIDAQFDIPKAKVDDKTIFDHLLHSVSEKETVDQKGNIKIGEQLASDFFEETYFNSYVAHATLETHTAVAKIEGNKVTVWASTQTPFRARDEIAEVLGFSSQNVRIISPFVGGGFGGKSRNQQAVEAARLAKLTGKPVQVAWSRQEEFFYDTFRPAAVVKIRSGIMEEAKIAFWDYNVYHAGERGSLHFYEVPHHRTVSIGGWGEASDIHPFGTGAWRAPGNNTNTFARESQIDIMASKAGVDPLEFRKKNLKDKQMTRVLMAAAKKFGWKPSKAPSGRGYGMACGFDVGTYVATIADVEVSKKTGNVQVKRVVCAQDMGLVINPEGAKMQIEGCITMGLGYALSEEIHFKGGEIYDLNFDTYELPRFSWLPEIDTVLVDANDMPPQGGGEPAIITMGAVIANAIYDAAGIRLFQLPMTPQRIKEAISSIK